MLRDGTYTAWFRTARGQGTAIVHLAEGRISGGDSFFNYGGAYEIEGDHFTATLTTRRFADGPTTVFGLDEVEVKLSGAFKGTIASCTGRAAQAPDVQFEATLFLDQNVGKDQPQQDPSQPALPQGLRPRSPSNISASNIARLPKANSDRYRPRNPFPPGSSR